MLMFRIPFWKRSGFVKENILCIPFYFLMMMGGGRGGWCDENDAWLCQDKSSLPSPPSPSPTKNDLWFVCVCVCVCVHKLLDSLSLCTSKNSVCAWRKGTWYFLVPLKIFHFFSSMFALFFISFFSSFFYFL